MLTSFIIVFPRVYKVIGLTFPLLIPTFGGALVVFLPTPCFSALAGADFLRSSMKGDMGNSCFPLI